MQTMMKNNSNESVAVRLRIGEGLNTETRESVFVVEARPPEHRTYGWLLFNGEVIGFDDARTARQFMHELSSRMTDATYTGYHQGATVYRVITEVLPAMYDAIIKRLTASERHVLDQYAINQEVPLTEENRAILQRLEKLGFVQESEHGYLVPPAAHMAWCQVCTAEVESEASTP